MIEVLIGWSGGLLIGATGIGSGSLIAPLLILAGYSPATAVGAGLVSLVVSKLTAAELYRRRGNLPARMSPLVGGGLTGVALVWLGARVLGHWNLGVEAVVRTSLGVGLLVIAVSLLFPRAAQSQRNDRLRRLREHSVLLFIIGAAVAAIVALTSAGAGGLLIPILLIVTRWEPPELAAAANVYGIAVGTTSVLVYVTHNALNFSLIGLVLIGLLPGVVVGTRLSSMISRPLLSRGAGLIAGYVGFALLFSRP